MAKSLGLCGAVHRNMHHQTLRILYVCPGLLKEMGGGRGWKGGHVKLASEYRAVDLEGGGGDLKLLHRSIGHGKPRAHRCLPHFLLPLTTFNLALDGSTRCYCLTRHAWQHFLMVYLEYT